MAKLSVDIRARSSNMDNARIIVQNLVQIIPVIINTYKSTAFYSAKAIAPQGPEQREGYEALLNYTIRKPKNRSTSLVNSIFLRSAPDNLSFSIGAENNAPDGVKVIMQEYGYPYDTTDDSSEDDDDTDSEKTGLRRGFKPYPPNPKNSKKYRKLENADIRGVGYLRAGLVSASKALAFGNAGSANRSDSLRVPYVSKADVVNYQNIVKDNIALAIQKFVIDYAKGRVNFSGVGLGTIKEPTTSSTGASKVPFSQGLIDDAKTRLGYFVGPYNKLNLQEFTPISKYTSKFGTVIIDFDGLLDIASNFGAFNTRTLSRRTSFTGREKAPRRDFLI